MSILLCFTEECVEHENADAGQLPQQSSQPTHIQGYVGCYTQSQVSYAFIVLHSVPPKNTQNEGFSCPKFLENGKLTPNFLAAPAGSM